MKKALIGTWLCLAILMSGCGNGQNSALPVAPSANIVTDMPAAETDAALETPGETPEIQEMDSMPNITVSVAGTVYQARLYDNDAARELMERLPLELDMEELHGNEKFYYLPEPLPTDTEHIGSIHTGDIMLYGSDCLVLFYEDFQTPFNYTRIGYLEEPDGLSDVLGSGTIRVAFNRAE